MILIKMRKDDRIQKKPLVTDVAHRIVAVLRADVHHDGVPAAAQQRGVSLPHIQLHVASGRIQARQIACLLYTSRCV